MHDKLDIVTVILSKTVVTFTTEVGFYIALNDKIAYT